MWEEANISLTAFLCRRPDPRRRKSGWILNRSNDGFFIAGEDLRLRGPGDLFGIRQSGILDFRLADVFQDAKLLQAASAAADKILKDDPLLALPGHEGLKNCIDEKMQQIMLETTL